MKKEIYPKSRIPESRLDYDVDKGELMTVYEAFCRMAQTLLSKEQLQSGRGEICLDFSSKKDDKCFFGQQWRLALDIKNHRSNLRFDDVVEYVTANCFRVLEKDEYDEKDFIVDGVLI